MISLLTINIRGLRKKKTRSVIFHKLNNNYKADVICVQESHITDELYDEWQNEWGGQLFYVPCTPYKMGEMILIRRDFDCTDL